MADSATDYINKLNDNLLHHFESAEWGSPIIAQIGGSGSQFRKSDSVDYVSKILSNDPNSFINDYTNDVNLIRSKYGLNELDANNLGDDPFTKNPVLGGLGGGLSATAIPQDTASTGGCGWTDIGCLAQSFGLNIAVFTIGITLMGLGILLLAYQNDTIRNGVKETVATTAKVVA